MEAFFQSINFWYWFVFAGVLLVIEVLVGGGFLFWIGISAIITGCVAWLIPSLSGANQTLCFAVGSLVVAILWWIYLKHRPIHTDEPRLNRRSEQYIGRTFTLDRPIQNGRGKIRVDDSMWSIECDEDLSAGIKIQVISVDGTLLKVSRTGSSTSEQH